MTDFVYLAEIASIVLGFGSFSLGVYSQFRPIEGARAFGGDGVANEKQATFVPIVFARNIAIGLAVMILGYQSERKAVGTILSCVVATGVCDVWWCAQHGSTKLGQHAVGTALFAGLGWMLL
ncbi:hypothetical protein LTR10_010024 [Elasticomyces elasticus]|nr:hypothetical protein LTR10_010024 [Elasticomyces elasticus]KAK4970316.1 hypothetical protein LTR42_008483 [Elasticomyces elasticus]